jgi:RimJ/RimL family protein N-acetyltransferase
MWEGLAARLPGGLVVVEPLEPAHEDALARAAAGLEVPFAVVDVRSGAPIGSTRYLMLRPEHRGLEIGWTWAARERWGTGANVEAARPRRP